MRSDEILQERYIYPGHPITIAYCIVSYFPTYEKAMELDHEGRVVTVQTWEIPGSGTAVHAALDMLRYLHDGTLDVKAAFAWADDAWKQCTDNKLYSGIKDTGQEQADRIKPKLLEHIDWWKKCAT